jgi:CRP/FNR family transcriptional regulator
MNAIRNIIASIPSFQGLESRQIEAIERIAIHRRLGKNELIFSDGDPGDGFYVVIKGQVKVFKLSPEGKEQILHVLGPGQPLGQVAVFAGRSFPANAQSLSNSQLLFFPRDKFVALIAEHPTMALKMLAVLSMRLREFTLQVENLSLKEVPGRLASYLILLSKEQNRQDAVTLPISKGQLASLLGTIPETLSRIFAKMVQLGLIAVNGRVIQILDHAGVESVAEHGRAID